VKAFPVFAFLDLDGGCRPGACCKACKLDGTIYVAMTL
jgi:hypothetical protein